MCAQQTRSLRAYDSSAEIRNQYIRKAAFDLSNQNGGDPDDAWINEWVKWAQINPLNKDELQDANKFWQEEFEKTDQHDQTCEKVQELQNQNTRKSKKQARSLNRGSFKVWKKDVFGCSAIADYFLKNYLEGASREDELTELHEKMVKYKASDEYAKQVERSRKRNRDEDPQKMQEVEIKIKIGKLRSLKRKMKSRQRHLNNGTLTEIPKADRASFAKFTSGKLDKEIDKLLLQHGYGQSHVDSNVRYEAPSLFDHV